MGMLTKLVGITFVTGLVIGGIIGWSVIWQIERLRDEMVRALWLADGEFEFDEEMESSLDALNPVERGYYYDEYFAARSRGQTPIDAHTTAHRRRAPFLGQRRPATMA